MRKVYGFHSGQKPSHSKWVAPEVQEGGNVRYLTLLSEQDSPEEGGDIGKKVAAAMKEMKERVEGRV